MLRLGRCLRGDLAHSVVGMVGRLILRWILQKYDLKNFLCLRTLNTVLKPSRHIPCSITANISNKQAKEIYQLKTTKRKPYRTNAAIWYNKICRQKRLTPTYINIRINGKNQQCQRTLITATQYRLNQEIKFLYTKKLKLNEQLYKLNLECADRWQNLWPIVLQTIENKLTEKMEAHYNNLNRKLDTLQSRKLDKSKTVNNQQGQQFYSRTVNLTKIKFSKEEMSLLDHGLGDRGGTVVKVLRYKSEGRWFDSRWCHWNFSLT